MKKNNIIGLVLLFLAVATLVGMYKNNNNYWMVYNYVTLAISVICGWTLFRQK